MNSKKTLVAQPPAPLPNACLTLIQYDNAKNAYHKVLQSDPNHAKVLQQLGWLHHQQSDDFQSQELAIEYLEKSVSSGASYMNSFLASTADSL